MDVSVSVRVRKAISMLNSVLADIDGEATIDHQARVTECVKYVESHPVFSKDKRLIKNADQFFSDLLTIYPNSNMRAQLCAISGWWLKKDRGEQKDCIRFMKNWFQKLYSPLYDTPIGRKRVVGKDKKEPDIFSTHL